MEAVDAMDAQTQQLEKDAFEPPVINPWRLPPSREQVRFAMDLCHTELPFPQRTIDGFSTMSRYEMSNLIRSLKVMRAKRLRGQARDHHWRLAPMAGRR
jgi:hypothetical protein